MLISMKFNSSLN